MSGPVIDLFAGPGGWAEAARSLGINEVGIELDAAACATRAAAGHRTIRADVSVFAVTGLPPLWGLAGSPVCITFSAAGKRSGNLVTEILAEGIRDAFAGRPTRARRRREAVAALKASSWGDRKWRRWQRSEYAWKAIRSASLMIEPARFIVAGKPEWVALEQVPSVLPLWRVYAEELAALGYSVWTGKLNSADYGVPQTRERAILIASRTRRVSRPEPTHYDPRKGMQLWGQPWIAMADALGWGAAERPSVAVTAGGTATGGAEPFGNRGRAALEAERDAGRWVLHTNRDQRPDGSRQTVDPSTAPAPAPALTSKSVGQRVYKRPATTVQGDPRIGRPGHKDRDRGESQFAQDSVRITVQEAAILQGFPADYPWQGTKTAQFTQCGNAVPVLLARHVLAMAAGVSAEARAAA